LPPHRDRVIQTSPPAARNWTLVGLAIALFALPLITASFRFAWGSPQSSAAYLARELALFVVLGVLLWIVLKREQLPLSSLGLRSDKVGRSVLWGLLGAVLCAVGLAACLAAISYFGLRFGGGGASQFSPPIWASLVTVLRAAVIEEVFYRGYAIDRLQRLTGSLPIATAIPLIVFAAAHYRQGTGGVLIALVMGAILSILFVKRRDLTAVVTAHFIVDVIPNVLLPLLSD
jgi:membrane protease YdiL (CAAX protease family)